MKSNRSRAAVLVFFDAEGVGDDRRTGAVGKAAQHALPCCVVEVLFLVGGTGIPLGQVIQQVIGQRAGGATEGAAGDVAPLVVAAEVALPTLARAGGTESVQSL